ncbi:MAG TPA: tripartite tricarboxylate transporter TctB family protein [Syntrophorhabdaceae bacterium]|nr:tripartite tricarboxylate transporter TctB family protein [Syntrophorhabdaceae bacterium]
MTRDLTSSLFFLMVSVVVFVGSIKLGLGTTRQPGPGFITFGASGLLGILSLVELVRAFTVRQAVQGEPMFKGTLWYRIILSALAILVYALVMPTLGYLIATFLLMLCLYIMMREQRWYWIIISSLLSSLASYYLFSKLLNCQFPDGLFWF